jgi:8-oxo-dGTP pyrophosphatase MutT (NUDIX family)
LKEKIKKILSQRIKRNISDEGLIKAAVLIPLYEKDENCYIVLTKRTELLNNHKGQISFPGGASQTEDKTLKDTALRESWEEIGLNPDDAEILGELDDELTYVTNFVITPFVAFIPYPYEFMINPKEVEEIIEIPLAELIDRGVIQEEIEVREGRVIPAYIYKYNDKIIWGATARILKHFIGLVGQKIT